MGAHTVCFAAPSPFLVGGSGGHLALSSHSRHVSLRPQGARRIPARRVRAMVEPAQKEGWSEDANSGLSSNVAPFSEAEIPGKMRLNELQVAEQRTSLDKYTMQLRKKKMAEDREAARLFGWVPFAETLNGRLAMFFIVTGVLTEYWTGYTLPQQVELMLRTLGVI